jgi:hypothetical protein
LPRAERQAAADDRDGQGRRGEQRHDVIGAVAGRAVPVTIEAILARQQPVQGIEEVVIGARPDLHDDEPGRGMWDEDGQQPVIGIDVDEERGAGSRQIGDTPGRAGSDGELARIYGKMLRRASRMRPMPPPAGADSYRSGSPPASEMAPHCSRPTAVL